MKKPSEMIRSHIHGGGNGYELDDLMTRRTGGIYDDLANRLVEVHQQFRSLDHPIGTSNPASFPELEKLAEELEEQGY